MHARMVWSFSVDCYTMGNESESALSRVAAKLARARRAQADAKHEATTVARAAIEAGVISERRAAELLGVERRSLRLWLGKG